MNREELSGGGEGQVRASSFIQWMRIGPLIRALEQHASRAEGPLGTNVSAIMHPKYIHPFGTRFEGEAGAGKQAE